MKNRAARYYRIIKNNYLISQPTLIAVVEGESVAEEVVERYNQQLKEEEKEAGWAHYAERTSRPART
jgi:hypothetical protein